MPSIGRQKVWRLHDSELSLAVRKPSVSSKYRGEFVREIVVFSQSVAKLSIIWYMLISLVGISAQVFLLPVRRTYTPRPGKRIGQARFTE